MVDEYLIYLLLPPCFGQFLSCYGSNKPLIALFIRFCVYINQW